MNTITMQDLKRHGSKALKKEGPMYLIVNSKMESVILPIQEFESLIDALEEYEDILDIHERKNDRLLEWKDVFPEDK